MDLDKKLQVRGIMHYPHLLRPQQYNGNERYGVVILIHESDPKVQEIRDGIDELIKVGRMPADTKTSFNPSKDFEGYFALNAYKPKEYRNGQRASVEVRDIYREPVIDESRIVAGHYAWFLVNLYESWGRINAGLNAVMILEEEGELGVLRSAISFDDFFNEVQKDVSPPNPPSPRPPAHAEGRPSSVAPTPPPPAAPAPPPPPPGAPKMTSKATASYEAYKEQGWSDDQLRDLGYIE